MPGMTSLGIRFPLQGETVDATSWQNMANDIDALMTSLDTIRDRATKPESAMIRDTIGSVTTTPASNTDGVLHFSQVSWDTSTFANLGANNDRLTLSTGVYYATATSDISAYTTMTQARIGLLTGSTLWAAQSIDTVSDGSLFLVASGVVVVTAAATALQVRCRWNGTGTAVFDAAGGNNLFVYKIREISDV